MGAPFFFTLQQCFFHPPFFFPPSKPSFFTLKNHFLPTLWNLFFSPFENLFFSPCTLPFSPCSMFLSPFTLFFSPFTLSFSPSTLSFQPSAGEAGNPWNLRRERCHLRLVSRRVCAAAKPVVVTSSRHIWQHARPFPKGLGSTICVGRREEVRDMARTLGRCTVQ